MKKKRIIIIIIILVIVVLTGAFMVWWEKQKNNGITSAVKKRAEEIVVSIVGKDYYNNHFIFVRASSNYNKNNGRYTISYEYYYDKDDVYTRNLFYLALNNNLEIIEYKLPECLTKPQVCNFPIEKNKAIEMAQQAGLEQGIKDWRVELNWQGEYFIWTVINTLHSNSNEYGSSADGHSISINTVTGEIGKIGDWAVSAP